MLLSETRTLHKQIILDQTVFSTSVKCCNDKQLVEAI